MTGGAAKHGFRSPVRALDGILPYHQQWLSKDIVAGVTLAALAIPEVMGYTKIAGTPVITGLYTILIPIAAFALFGSSRHLVVGGDSATAAIMYAGIAGLGITGLQPNTPQWLALASLSALLAAGFLFLARVARLGFLANFLSRTVLIGFLTGVGDPGGDRPGRRHARHPDADGRDRRLQRRRVRKFGLTLWDIGDASWQTTLVSIAVLAILIVFARWVKAVPGGLVAVVGTIAASWIFDFAAHDVSTLGPVPSGLPHIGFPHGVTWSDTTALLAHRGVDVPRDPRAERRHRRARTPSSTARRSTRGTDLVGLGVANLGAGFSSTFVVNGSPTKTEMVDEAKSHTQVAQLTTAVDRRDRPAVPHQAAAVPAERGARLGRLPDRPQADRHREHARDLRLRKDEFVGRAHHDDRRRRGRRRAGRSSSRSCSR